MKDRLLCSTNFVSGVRHTLIYGIQAQLITVLVLLCGGRVFGVMLIHFGIIIIVVGGWEIAAPTAFEELINQF